MNMDVKQQHQKYNKYTWLTLGVIFITDVHAATSMDQILTNMRNLVRPVMGMLMMISFVIGVVMMLRGLLMMRQFSLPLNQASKPGEIAGPLVHMFVGAMLIYIPAATDSLSITIFNTGGTELNIMDINTLSTPQASQELLGYTSTIITDQWANLFDTVVTYIQLIGFIAFLRGWILIGEAGQPGVQPGSITRGLVHIIGGILAINFIPFVQAIQNTLYST